MLKAYSYLVLRLSSWQCWESINGVWNKTQVSHMLGLCTIRSLWPHYIQYFEVTIILSHFSLIQLLEFLSFLPHKSSKGFINFDFLTVEFFLDVYVLDFSFNFQCFLHLFLRFICCYFSHFQVITWCFPCFLELACI